MRAFLHLLSFGLLAMLFFAGEASAQNMGLGSVSIQVQVRQPDGSAPPAGVLVELDFEDGTLLQENQTDSSGRCHFTAGADSAAYLVRARQSGYYEARVRLDVQNTHSGFANLTLSPIPGEAPLVASRGASGATVSAIDLSVPEAARMEFERGQKAIEAHDLDGGVAHFKKAIEIHDQFPRAYGMLALVYNEQKRWKDAQNAAEKALELDPKAVEAYFQLGASLNQQKDAAGAVKALNQGLQLNPAAPGAAAAHYELARAFMALGQWQDANVHASEAVAMRPDIAPWHVLMGNIKLKKGDGRGAIDEFRTYLKLDPNGSAASSIHEMMPRIESAMAKK